MESGTASRERPRDGSDCLLIKLLSLRFNIVNMGQDPNFDHLVNLVFNTKDVIISVMTGRASSSCASCSLLFHPIRGFPWSSLALF